jgi:hypothetical protein
MSRKIAWVAQIFIVLSAGFVFAQLVKPEDPVKIVFLPAKTAVSGQSAEARVEIEIKKDWHLFSEKPEIRGVLATKLEFEPSKLFTVEKISFPKPDAIYSDVFGKTLNFYQNKVSVILALKILENAKGEVPVEGTLKYQTCSNTLCLPPKTQKFSGIQHLIAAVP